MEDYTEYLKKIEDEVREKSIRLYKEHDKQLKKLQRVMDTALNAAQAAYVAEFIEEQELLEYQRSIKRGFYKKKRKLHDEYYPYYRQRRSGHR